jgi:hypothetical protein
METDGRAVQAREHHRAAGLLRSEATDHIEIRNRLMHSLREDGWTYERIARAVGCSEPLVAKILQGRS